MSFFSFFFFFLFWELKKKKEKFVKKKKKKIVKKKKNRSSAKPLTITDLLSAPMHGSQLQVAYQGVPSANSEAAAGKAYPNYKAIPCDQFEVAFQAVELWIVD